MSDLAQFSALAALIIGGFGLFAFMFTRLERRIDRLDVDMKELRRDMAGEFRAQRAEVAAQVSAIANTILATRSS
jgi:hypothetical protein